MKNEYTINYWQEKTKIRLFETKYSSNNTLAIVALDEYGEEFCKLSVNLNSPMQGDNLAFVDTNNLPWVEQFLQENDIAYPMFYSECSGWCNYPLYGFNKNKMEVFDETNW